MKKIASMNDDEMPRTPKDAMAPKDDAEEEAAESEKERMGEMDLDHLMRAEDIKGDPKKMEYVKKAHAKKTIAMRSIADLKVAGQALAAKKKESMPAPLPKRVKGVV